MTDIPAFEIRTSQRDVLVAGQPVPLGARAFDVLAYLDAHRGRVVSKKELLDAVWGGVILEAGNLSVQISALRKVLGPRAISTVPGVGYQLAAGVTPEPTISPHAPLPLPYTPSLAVLPFVNMTGLADTDYLVDGIVTDLIAVLTRVPGFFVIAATSSFKYKGRAVDLADVGRELGVRYVLEGSIQHIAGKTLRITPQLVEAASGRAIWSERFGGTIDDVFALQDTLTENVAAAIEPTLRAAEAVRSREKPPQDLLAYDLCPRAEPTMPVTAKPEDFRRAFALLDKAVALDPDYAFARALRCWAYTAAAGGRFIAVRDCGVAVRDARSALGPILLGLGRVEEAIDMSELAFNEGPSYGSTIVNLIMSYFRAGRMDESKAMADRLLAIKPDLTVHETVTVSPFKHAPHLRLMADAMRAAGVPEG